MRKLQLSESHIERDWGRTAGQGDGPEPEKKKYGATKKPSEMPSPGAQRFIDFVSQEWPTLRSLKPVMEPWLNARGDQWRPVRDFLSGREPRFSEPKLLAEFVSEKIGEAHDYREFLNLGVPNYAAEFCTKNYASAFLQYICGSYECVRPAIDVLLEPAKKFSISAGGDLHMLELAGHRDSQPGTFTYKSKTSAGEDLGAWAGYALAKMPYIFLCGFCVHGDDRIFPTEAASGRTLQNQI